MRTKFLNLKYALLSLALGSAFVSLFADNEFYYHEDLHGMSYAGQSLINSKFQWCNLQDASFSTSTLIGASFLNSDIRGVDFTDVVWAFAGDASFHPDNFKAEQIYETSSYKIKDLSGVNFTGNCLSGWDFSGQNLTNVSFHDAYLFAASSDFFKKYFGITYNDVGATNFTNAVVNGADFSGTSIRGIFFGEELNYSFSKEQLYSTASYKNKDLSGIILSGNDLRSWDFSGQNLQNAKFDSVKYGEFSEREQIEIYHYTDLSDADFTDADIKGAGFAATNLTMQQLYSTASYKEGDLSGVSLGGKDLNAWDFSGQNLQKADFSSKILDWDTGENMSAKEFISNLKGANFSNANIKGSNFAMTNFSKEQLYSTASYKSGDLSGISFGGNDLSSWDFSGQNLQNADFSSKNLANYFVSRSFATNLDGANFAKADLRGANMSGVEGSPIYKNTIMTDGRIENFSMTSASDSFSIRKYEPVSSGGALISAKLDTSSTISGGAVLALERGADFEITNNSILTVAQASAISINTDVSSSTSFSILAGSGLVFENGATLEINIEAIFTTGDTLSFVVFDWENGGNFIGDFVKDESVFLSLNGEKFDGDWDFQTEDNNFIVSISQVPEPATYAVVFGALTLLLVLNRKKSCLVNRGR